MPAADIRLKIESSMKLLRGIVVASTALLTASGAIAANTYMEMPDVRLERMVCKRSGFGRNAAGSFRKLQSVPAADSASPDATIKANTANQFRFMRLPINIAVIHQ